MRIKYEFLSVFLFQVEHDFTTTKSTQNWSNKQKISNVIPEICLLQCQNQQNILADPKKQKQTATATKNIDLTIEEVTEDIKLTP